ncbi:hypothetical protein [Methanobrevibacter sp.]|uniref:hypothetical protein n=1 Tax=Methanobrevibacter sp. TaxID=66852 RepID=UPI00388F9A21
MSKRNYIIIAILIIILGVGIVALNESKLLNTENAGQAPEASAISREVIANSTDDPGSVEVIRNVGNPSGEKIAYVVGVHPLEHETHETLVKLLPTVNDLNYCYDIYIINVTEDVGYYGDGASDNSQGRQNGQNLAYKYVYPEIANGSYKAAVDVHSNVGAYPYQTFVFSPILGGSGEKCAVDVASKCENISYYTPESTTSGPFLTEPLNNNGIPAFYFEEYSFANQSVKDMHMMELIRAVDGLKF